MNDHRADLARALERVSSADLRLIANLSQTPYMREVAADELARREASEVEAHARLA